MDGNIERAEAKKKKKIKTVPLSSGQAYRMYAYTCSGLHLYLAKMEISLRETLISHRQSGKL